MHNKAVYNLAVGMTLKELHDEQHVDREKLANALETSEITISKIEHGDERMTAGELILMLYTFNLSWDDFMRRVRKNLPEAGARIR